MLKHSVQEARNEQSKEYGRKKLIKIETEKIIRYKKINNKTLERPPKPKARFEN